MNLNILNLTILHQSVRVACTVSRILDSFIRICNQPRAKTARTITLPLWQSGCWSSLAVFTCGVDYSSARVQVVMEVGGACSVTAVDVAEHPVVGALAAGRGELTGLALWLMAEREQVRVCLFVCLCGRGRGETTCARLGGGWGGGLGSMYCSTL